MKLKSSFRSCVAIVIAFAMIVAGITYYPATSQAASANGEDWSTTDVSYTTAGSSYGFTVYFDAYPVESEDTYYYSIFVDLEVDDDGNISPTSDDLGINYSASWNWEKTTQNFFDGVYRNNSSTIIFEAGSTHTFYIAVYDNNDTSTYDDYIDYLVIEYTFPDEDATTTTTTKAEVTTSIVDQDEVDVDSIDDWELIGQTVNGEYIYISSTDRAVITGGTSTNWGLYSGSGDDIPNYGYSGGAMEGIPVFAYVNPDYASDEAIITVDGISYSGSDYTYVGIGNGEGLYMDCFFIAQSIIGVDEGETVTYHTITAEGTNSDSTDGYTYALMSRTSMILDVEQEQLDPSEVTDWELIGTMQSGAELYISTTAKAVINNNGGQFGLYDGTSYEGTYAGWGNYDTHYETGTAVFSYVLSSSGAYAIIIDGEVYGSQDFTTAAGVDNDVIFILQSMLDLDEGSTETYHLVTVVGTSGDDNEYTYLLMAKEAEEETTTAEETTTVEETTTAWSQPEIDTSSISDWMLWGSTEAGNYVFISEADHDVISNNSVQDGLYPGTTTATLYNFEDSELYQTDILTYIASGTGATSIVINGVEYTNGSEVYIGGDCIYISQSLLVVEEGEETTYYTITVRGLDEDAADYDYTYVIAVSTTYIQPTYDLDSFDDDDWMMWGTTENDELVLIPKSHHDAVSTNDGMDGLYNGSDEIPQWGGYSTSDMCGIPVLSMVCGTGCTQVIINGVVYTSDDVNVRIDNDCVHIAQSLIAVPDGEEEAYYVITLVGVTESFLLHVITNYPDQSSAYIDNGDWVEFGINNSLDAYNSTYYISESVLAEYSETGFIQSRQRDLYDDDSQAPYNTADGTGELSLGTKASLVFVIDDADMEAVWIDGVKYKSGTEYCYIGGTGDDQVHLAQELFALEEGVAEQIYAVTVVTDDAEEYTFGIKVVADPLDAPDNLTDDSTDDNVNYFTWDAVDRAVEYNIYVDGELVATTTDTYYDFDDDYFEIGVYTISVTAVNGELESETADLLYAVGDGEWVDFVTSDDVTDILTGEYQYYNTTDLYVDTTLQQPDWASEAGAYFSYDNSEGVTIASITVNGVDEDETAINGSGGMIYLSNLELGLNTIVVTDTAGQTYTFYINVRETCSLYVDDELITKVIEEGTGVLPDYTDDICGYYDEDGNLYQEGTEIDLSDGDVYYTSLTVSVKTTSGASIYIDTTASDWRYAGSIRFQGTIETNAQDALTYGMLLASIEVYQSEGELTVDTENAVNLSAASEETSFSYTAKITNINYNFYNQSYVAKAYVVVDYSDGTVSYIYGDVNSESGRSVASVAAKIQAAGYGSYTDDTAIEMIDYFSGFYEE